MIEETKKCSKCQREIPVTEMKRGHEYKCHGVVQDNQDFRETEIEMEPQQPLLFATRSKRKDELVNDYSSQSMQYSIDSNSIICPKCTARLDLQQIGTHDCNYLCCEYCSEYYPHEVLEQHREFCHHNPYKNYAKQQPHPEIQTQQPHVARHHQASPHHHHHQTGVQQPVFSQVQEEVLPQPDGSLLIRRVQRTNNGFNVSERRVFQRGPPMNVMEEQPNIMEERHQPMAQEPFALFPHRNLMDDFGPFFMFGHNPFEPMMRTRSIFQPIDPFDQLLRDHVNFVRINRRRMFDPSFITIILDMNAGNPNPHLSRQDLIKLETCKYKKPASVKEGEEDKCPICLVEFGDGEDIKNLPCKHMFHPNCIDTWLVKNSACPICKRDVLEGINRS